MGNQKNTKSTFPKKESKFQKLKKTHPTLYYNISKALTPKFFKALFATSCILSGFIFAFEVWYYRHHGVSFMEQKTVNWFAPWLHGINTANFNGNVHCNLNNNGIHTNSINHHRARYQNMMAKYGNNDINYHG